MDDTRLEWLCEDVETLKQQVNWLTLYVANYIVQSVPCTCGFGGQHEPERDICERNIAAQKLAEQIKSGNY